MEWECGVCKSVESKMWSGKYGVWSVKCGVESVGV